MTRKIPPAFCAALPLEAELSCLGRGGSCDSAEDVQPQMWAGIPFLQPLENFHHPMSACYGERGAMHKHFQPVDAGKQFGLTLQISEILEEAKSKEINWRFL